jgi:hypothetical protein
MVGEEGGDFQEKFFNTKKNKKPVWDFDWQCSLIYYQKHYMPGQMGRCLAQFFYDTSNSYTTSTISAGITILNTVPSP